MLALEQELGADVLEDLELDAVLGLVTELELVVISPETFIALAGYGAGVGAGKTCPFLILLGVGAGVGAGRNFLWSHCFS